MNQHLWSAVDNYITDLFAPEDPILDAALKASSLAGLPPHNVSPNQGKLLYLLARITGARHILEIGTLGGYSTIWLARALPADGRLITLEVSPVHAEVALANIRHAGLSNVVEVRVGRAVDSLAQIASEGRGPFDLIFIDADKPSNAEYLKWALKLARLGTVIVADNVVRNGMVIDDHSSDASVQGIRRFKDMLASEPGIATTAIQTVGSKGYDGFSISLVTDEPMPEIKAKG